MKNGRLFVEYETLTIGRDVNGQDNQENDDPQAVAQDNCQPGKLKNPASQRG